MLTDEEVLVVADRLEGWELVEFLGVSAADVLLAALDFDWVHERNVKELLELVGLKQEEEDD